LLLLFVAVADMLVARKPTNRDSDASDKLLQFRISNASTNVGYAHEAVKLGFDSGSIGAPRLPKRHE